MLNRMQWETVVGFEVHTELLTDSKVWCGCSTEFGRSPNTQTCPVCLGMPGSLPVLNRRAMDLAMRAALALNCTIVSPCQFERKNYYYPDLPKNYQISQLRKNLGVDGVFEFPVGGRVCKVRFDNVHLEEDAGKNIHLEEPGADYSLVDLNRAGTPLLEIVSQPDLRSVEEAEAFMNTMKTLLEYIEVSDCNMHEGRLRFEANISVRPEGSDKLGTKVEIKNLNSMKVVLKCIEVETERQVELIEDGGEVVQETRLWDEAASVTRVMRGKEEANDYRYFPDPDLVEVVIDEDWIGRVRSEIPELPNARRRRFMDALGLSEYDSGVLTADKSLADYFEGALDKHPNAKSICNWITSEVLRWLNEDSVRELAGYPIRPDQLADLVRLIDKGTISGRIGKQVYTEMLETGGDPGPIVREKGLVQISDESAIEPIIDEVIANNPKSVEDFRNGKDRALGALVGQVMKATMGKANPATVNALLRKKIHDG
jgi:aspartyl-tRNA(Asn)/glutamyl-tRNA(Gln) amidotransferase subunit B